MLWKGQGSRYADCNYISGATCNYISGATCNYISGATCFHMVFCTILLKLLFIFYSLELNA